MILTLIKQGNLCDAAVYANGKLVNFKREKLQGGKFADVARVNIDGRVELSLIKRSPLSFDNWLFRTALFWLIGIFGLFSPRFPKRYDTLNYKLTADLSGDAQITIKVNSPRADQPSLPPVYAVSDVPFSEENNVWQTDNIAKKRRKGYRIFNTLFWILAVVAIIAIVFIAGNA